LDPLGFHVVNKNYNSPLLLGSHEIISQDY
jgi:hypothetical protein